MNMENLFYIFHHIRANTVTLKLGTDTLVEYPLEDCRMFDYIKSEAVFHTEILVPYRENPTNYTVKEIIDSIISCSKHIQAYDITKDMFYAMLRLADLLELNRAASKHFYRNMVGDKGLFGAFKHDIIHEFRNESIRISKPQFKILLYELFRANGLFCDIRGGTLYASYFLQDGMWMHLNAASRCRRKAGTDNAQRAKLNARDCANFDRVEIMGQVYELDGEKRRFYEIIKPTLCFLDVLGGSHVLPIYCLKLLRDSRTPNNDDPTLSNNAQTLNSNAQTLSKNDPTLSNNDAIVSNSAQIAGKNRTGGTKRSVAKRKSNLRKNSPRNGHKLAGISNRIRLENIKSMVDENYFDFVRDSLKTIWIQLGRESKRNIERCKRGIQLLSTFPSLQECKITFLDSDTGLLKMFLEGEMKDKIHELFIVAQSASVAISSSSGGAGSSIDGATVRMMGECPIRALGIDFKVRKGRGIVSALFNGQASIWKSIERLELGVYDMSPADAITIRNLPIRHLAADLQTSFVDGETFSELENIATVLESESIEALCVKVRYPWGNSSIVYERIMKMKRLKILTIEISADFAGKGMPIQQIAESVEKSMSILADNEDFMGRIARINVYEHSHSQKSLLENYFASASKKNNSKMHYYTHFHCEQICKPYDNS